MFQLPISEPVTGAIVAAAAALLLIMLCWLFISYKVIFRISAVFEFRPRQIKGGSQEIEGRARAEVEALRR